MGQFHRGFYWSSVLRGAGRFAHQYTEPRGDDELVTQAELRKRIHREVFTVRSEWLSENGGEECFW